MTNVSELTPEQGVELALTILLEKGFSSKYYESWQEYAKSEYDEEFYANYSVRERQGAWEAFQEYVTKNQPAVSKDGITATWLASHRDGDWQDSEVYFVILSLSDDSGTRYFMREGYYHSYDGGHLDEAEDKEVFPKEKTVTVWSNV